MSDATIKNNTRDQQRVHAVMHSCANTKKKCGAHTHVHHISRSLFSIFTSVVVYSRTTTTYKIIKTKNSGLAGSLITISTTVSFINKQQSFV